jgi:nucleoid DNA-binding protein
MGVYEDRKNIAEKSGVTMAVVETVLNNFGEQIELNLKEGKELLLPGIFIARTVATKDRKGRNPKTGESLNIKSKNIVRFKVSTRLKNNVSPK